MHTLEEAMGTDEKLRILVVGAHPDDADATAGGVAALYSERGHTVKMLSLTNGDAGHQDIGGAPLAWRRKREAEAAGRAVGAEYILFDNHDGELMPTLQVRNQLIAFIREFEPDMVMSPRPWDYHPDHRAAGQLVMDAMYMLTVPNAVAMVPHLRKMPVGVYVADRFKKPYPFEPGVVIDIDPVIERKLAALDAHESQMYEWLPYNRNELDQVPADAEARRVWLRERWYGPRGHRLADEHRDLLIARYGPERGGKVQFAEAFEGSEYGSPLTEEAIKRLFPF
jgi:LmbE family N-acetylglucosaminyl deacetylase